MIIIITYNIPTIDLISIFILATFRPICTSAFFRCFIPNSGIKASVRHSMWTPEFDGKHLKMADYNNKDQMNSPNILRNNNYLFSLNIS